MAILPYMQQAHRKEFTSEAYVSSPPAAFVYDERGNNFSLGLRYRTWNSRDGIGGHMSFNVLRNGYETGEFASHIERRNGKVRILTTQGWKRWNGKSFI